MSTDALCRCDAAIDSQHPADHRPKLGYSVYESLLVFKPYCIAERAEKGAQDNDNAAPDAF